ncbi:MAG: type I restriction-modification system subunit M, partial [Thiotrichaceae bacterium]|nr:type I restriction-modification system subunit M [Thiotrichaceae bacterium]
KRSLFFGMVGVFYYLYCLSFTLIILPLFHHLPTYLMSEEELRRLRQQLWNIADALRGKMHADEFRDYMLGFIFYKYLSEKMEAVANTVLKEDKVLFQDLDEKKAQDREYIDALKENIVDDLGYFLKPSETFRAIALKGQQPSDDESHFIIGDLERIFKNIEQSTHGTDSEEDFANLFEDLDLTSSKLGNTEKAKNTLIAEIMGHLNQIDFLLHETDVDVLGDAYEYLIGEFASNAGKKAGEFYTPQPVSSLLARLVTCGNKNIRNVYDPTCGSGSLLLRVKREAQIKHNLKIYGQELNRTTYNLARMNMILHDVHYADFDLRQDDTLENPLHLYDSNGHELRFDAIVANPPFSANWKASPAASDERFSVYGKLAPKTKADMAFLQHMIYQLSDNGVLACVLPHGVLFRGAAEGHIRRYMIERLNYLDAVIGLPANIFYGTSIPTCVLVFKRCRSHSDDILFIDASQGFEKLKKQNKLLSVHIDRILEVYEQWENIEKFSRVVGIKEIAENDFNLNIPRYVDTFEAEESIDLDGVVADLAGLAKEGEATDRLIAGFCQELGIKAPV